MGTRQRILDTTLTTVRQRNAKVILIDQKGTHQLQITLIVGAPFCSFVASFIKIVGSTIQAKHELTNQVNVFATLSSMELHGSEVDLTVLLITEKRVYTQRQSTVGTTAKNIKKIQYVDGQNIPNTDRNTV